MNKSIPDYYRHLAEQRAASNAERDAPSSQPAGDAEDTDGGLPTPVSFRAHTFRMDLPPDAWTDRSLYTLTGPTIDGIQHNISIHQAPGVEQDDLDGFIEEQIAMLEASLERCQMLHQDTVALDCGLDAGRAIYFWYPTDDLKLYQEQLYVLHEETAYTLTASFTARTRKTVGAAVEQMMRSFTPRAQQRREER